MLYIFLQITSHIYEFLLMNREVLNINMVEFIIFFMVNTYSRQMWFLPDPQVDETAPRTTLEQGWSLVTVLLYSWD